jgi:hypothetical protein
VYKWQIQALNLVYTTSQMILDNCKNYENALNWQACFDMLNEYPKHASLLFDLTKWRFRSAYTGLEIKLIVHFHQTMTLDQQLTKERIVVDEQP